MHRDLILMLAIVSAWALAPTAQAQVRLIGITGNQEANPESDETLFEINLTNASTTSLLHTAHVPDTDSIGYNPVDGRLYHISGGSTYRDTPGQNGYRDNQYMESFDLDAADPAASVIAVFNANPPEVPDMSAALEFGLPAPFPNWVLPDHPRTDEETDPAIGDLVGPGEFDSARDMAWSPADNLFYLTSGRGFYTMTPDGQSAFVGKSAIQPGDMKGIAFVDVNGQTKLYAGAKEQEPNSFSSFLYEIDPATGQELDMITIMAPISADAGAPLESNHRILGLTQHPETGVLYGLLEPIGSDPLSNRQLVTIDLDTGVATLIGELTTPDVDAAFASIAFVGFSAVPPGLTGDFNNDGSVDAADYVLWRDGGELQNDPTPGNQAEDYNVWRANFGNSVGGSGAALSSAAVPEPTTLVLLALALGFASLRRRS